MLELFPEGFEELAKSDRVELAVYTDGAGAARMWRAFGEYSWREVPEDWAERWRLFHKPVRIGRLWIGPPWEEPAEEALAVVIDPGRAFGTGAHETTRLCLELLLELEPGSLLDVGCGSGILSIAASRLGFSPIIAVDDDPIAVGVALQNAVLNEVQLDVRLADGTQDVLPCTDIAVANISALATREIAARLTSPRLISAGYLESDCIALPGYRQCEHRTKNGWAADLLERA